MEKYLSVNLIIIHYFKIPSAGSVIHFILTYPRIFNPAMFGFGFSEVNFAFNITEHKGALVV